MRSTLLLAAAAALLAGCTGIPFLDDEANSSAPAPVMTTASVPDAKLYEIRDADRGLVRRVKVLLNGRTVDTIVLSRSRSAASSYCCTEDSCKEIQLHAACTTFKMTCTVDGTCVRDNASPSTRL